jgi:WD40 repeat protein
MIAAAADSGSIHLFDDRGAKIGELPPSSGEPEAPLAMVFSPDNHTLAVAYSDRIVLRDLTTHPARAQVRNLDENLRGLKSLAFTATGDRLAVISEDHATLRFYDRNGAPAGELPTLTRNVTALAFRPDGQGFITGEAGGLVRRWTMDGKQIDPLIRTSKSRIIWVAVDAGSQLLFTSDDSGPAIRTYPSPTQDPSVEVIASFAMPLEITSAALSPDDNWIVTVDPTGVKIWPARFPAFLRETCRRIEHHGVWKTPAFAEGFPPELIPTVHDYCASQVWNR